MMQLKLYGNPLSGHTYKVKLFLALTDMPLLMIDDVPLVQSNAILLYLSQKLNVLHWGAGRQWVVEWLMWEQGRLGHSLPNLRFSKRFVKDTDPAVLT